MESAQSVTAAIERYSAGIGLANNGIATLYRLGRPADRGTGSIFIEGNLASLTAAEASVGLLDSARTYAQRITNPHNAFTAYLALSMNTPSLTADNPDLLITRWLSKKIEPLYLRVETLIQIGILEVFHGVGTPKLTLEAARYALRDSLKLERDSDIRGSVHARALLGALEKHLGLDPGNTFDFARLTIDRLKSLTSQLDTLFWIAESELFCGTKPDRTVEKIKAILGNGAIAEEYQQKLIVLETETANIPPKSPLEEGHWFIRSRPTPYYPLPDVGFRVLLNEAAELACKGILPTRQIDEAKQIVLIDKVKNDKTADEYREIAATEVAIGDILVEDAAAIMRLLTEGHYNQIVQEAIAGRRRRLIRALGTVLPPDYQTNLLASLPEDTRPRIKSLFSQGRAYRG